MNEELDKFFDQKPEMGEVKIPDSIVGEEEAAKQFDKLTEMVDKFVDHGIARVEFKYGEDGEVDTTIVRNISTGEILLSENTKAVRDLDKLYIEEQDQSLN